MARPTKLGDALLPSHEEDTPAEEQAQATTEQDTTSSGSTSTDAKAPRKKSSAAKRATTSKATKKDTGKKAAGKKTTTKANQETSNSQRQGAQQSTEPVVLGIDTQGAERLSIYLHPDDKRALLLARAENGTDANSLIRAMIALWRANPRIRTQIDRLARTAPRGGQP